MLDNFLGTYVVVKNPKPQKKEVGELRNKLSEALCFALMQKDHVSRKHFLCWGLSDLLNTRNSLTGDIAKLGNKENISFALDHGMDIDWKNGYGNVLHWAVDGGNLDGVKLFVKQKAGLIHEERHCDKQKPFEVAQKPHFTTIHKYAIQAYLLEKGADKHFRTLHQILAHEGWNLEPDLVKALLDIGWDRTITDEEGKTPLDIAIRRGSDKIVKILETYQTVRAELDPVDPTS